MFDSNEYTGRRQQLKAAMASNAAKPGLILFPGAVSVTISSPHNGYPFRQDASFAYFFALSRPGLAAVIDLEDGKAILFGDEQSDADMIWHGVAPISLAQEAAAAGIDTVQPAAALQAFLSTAIQQQRAIHYLPPYRAESTAALSHLLQRDWSAVGAGTSLTLIQAVVAQREIKSVAEITDMRQAMAIAHDMHLAAFRHARDGVHEYEVVAEMECVLRRHDSYAPYTPIFSRHGEILHNHAYGNRLATGDLVVNDSGAASKHDYVSDITRTIPVGGRFSARQDTIYNLVLDAQLAAIAAIAPGVAYRDLHRLTALHMVRGLCALGLFRGNPEDVVDSGAYALCFPHGLGHQLGLDVHDMESYGEDLVGYDAAHRRSALFGLRSLRLAKPLRAGMVVTVEPGLYFIGQLIQQWQAENRHARLIDYAAFNAYADFGGIRIEDNVLVTDAGADVLSRNIPKTCSEIQEIMAQ